MRWSALLVGGLAGQLTTPDLRGVEAPPDDSPDWDACELDVARQGTKLARLAAGVIAVFIVAWWPVDLLLIHREAAAQALFTQWRLTQVGIFAAMFAALTYVPAARRYPVASSFPFCFAACASLAYLVGGLGGLEQPYFYMMCVVLVVPAAAPVRLPVRAAFHGALALALMVGFFGPRPGYASNHLWWEAQLYLLSWLAATILLGHVVYVGTCHRFFQSLRVSRTAEELATLNRTLDVRVREKTAELARLTEHLQVVQDQERGRIARELHDELGQRLSALRFALANARRRFGLDPATIAANLLELDGMLDGSLQCMSAIVSGLRPPLLEQLGLAAAIEWLAQQTTKQLGLRCVLELDEGDTSDPAVSIALYRVVQEALTNVQRHACASAVTVRLRVSPGALFLEVADDGVGFAPQSAGRPTDRNGLLGMRERAYALGGELVTDNAPDGGARVRLTLPLKAAPPTATATAAAEASAVAS